MRFGLIAYPKKPLIIAHSGVPRETRCLKVVQSFLQFAYWRGHAYMQAPQSLCHMPM